VTHQRANVPDTLEERSRLYIDESGDHVFRHLDDPSHRYLCVLGSWFRGRDYGEFHSALQAFKQRHIPHSPDDPVVLHREDIVGRHRSFWRLRDQQVAEAFDRDLLDLIRSAEFRICAVLIDKKHLLDRFDVPSHPYNLALGFMLQRYCGFLNYINRRGDVMAESRGGTEDRVLKDSYVRVYKGGAWMRRAPFFQQALTSKELKLKQKRANIAGLQLADLLAHPVRQTMLLEKQRIPGPLSEFARKMAAIAEARFNRHLYDQRVWGYGKVWYPG